MPQSGASGQAQSGRCPVDCANEGAWTDIDLIGGDAVIDFTAIDVSMPFALLDDRLDMEAVDQLR